MPRNGTGTMIRETPVATGTVAWADTVTAGDTTITTVDHDFHDQDLAAALTASIANDGQTPILANLPMSGFKHTGVASATARTQYASAGQIQDGGLTWAGTTGGTASAYTVALSPSISGYVDGMNIRLRVNATNTGNSTLEVNSSGAKGIYKNTSSGPVAVVTGDMGVGQDLSLTYDSTLAAAAGGWVITGQFASLPFNYIAGLAISNNSGTPNTKIDVAAGMAMDSTNASLISFTGAAKTVDFAVSGANGLDTGSIAGSTWYAILVIFGTSGTAVLATKETAGSPISPTMPTGYTLYRYVGSVKTDGSVHLLAFTQFGQTFYWAAGPQDVSAGSPVTSPTLLTLSIPRAFQVYPILAASAIDTAFATKPALLIYSPSASVNSTYFRVPALSTTLDNWGNCSTVLSNTSGQVLWNFIQGSLPTVTIITNGWIDPHVAANW